MWIQQYDSDAVLPMGDNFSNPPAEVNEMEWETGLFEIDGTGKLQITSTGGTSAAEGGMGSGSESEKEKGDLQEPSSSEKGGKPNTDPNTGFDPVKENIDEATAKRNKEE
ncbi:hypothetical protein FC093_10610 [Ilyomonas limi]|uniref:Uncharacterized protein n=1 Tax=Ilyomonas limi TaxID=2575867 RepID=A0A4U3L0S3_9BACT|nr:hypothetical protein [Ilyomonas limi]TKK68565.1 hypothetical protein FC093_10610 [Ilyomonas limi]